MRKVLIPLLLAIMLLPAVVQAQLTLPYTTGFEGLTTGQLPTGWSQLQSGSSGSGTFPAVYQYASNARNGSVYFEFESTTGQTELAALPVVSDVSQLQLSFYASVMNHNFLFEVGVMDSTTFEPVDTIALTVGSGGNWHGSYNQYTVYFNNYTGLGNRMAMRVTSSGSYTLMIDDLEIDYIPTCPAPTNFAATGSSVDWITLNWQENGVATAWVVEYDTVPIPASQLGLGVAGQEMVSGVPGVTINGLDTATTYYFYVYADCGGEYSTAASLTATTLAALPAEVPYSCDFEQDGPNGWDLINGSQTNKWCVGSATNNGGNQSLYISNDNGTSNSYSTGSTSYTYAVRSFDLTDSGEYAYGYDWKCQGESHYYDFCRAFLAPATYQWTAGTNPADGTYAFASWSMPSGWIELTEDFSSPRTMSQSSNWRTVTGTFYISTPGTYSIVFAWANDVSGGSQPPMAVDNVFLTRNTCPGPSNFAATGSSVDWITLNWQQNGDATSWVVEYDTVPIPVSQLGQGVASQEMVSGVPGVTINGLDTATTYYFYVYADCGGEYSIAASLTATTLAALPAEVPYACDFEQEGPNGWELINGSQTNKWCVGSATNNGGNQSLYISDNNGTSNSYSTSSTSYTYAFRTFDLTDSGEYAYGYDWKCQGESHNYDFCRAFLAPASYQWTAGTNPAGGTYAFASWSMPSGWFELTENFSSPRTMALSSSWRTVTGTFYISTPGTYSIVFAWANDASGGSQPPMAVDNVFLTHNTCPGPLNLTASYVANDTVVITWQPGGSESSWIVSDGVNSYDVYDTTYLFEGLMPATNYNFYVYALCDGGDTSLPATVSVRTPCSEFGPLPLIENFDSYSSSSYPDCWTRIQNSSSYPYITTSYGICIQSGGGASSISPRIPAPLNNLFVEFDLRKEGSSSGSMSFGYTRDPNSVDNMVVIQTIDPTSTGQYYHYEFDLSGDTCTDSVYLVWRQDGTSAIWYYWLDNVSVSRASSCPAVVNLRCNSHTNHEASIVWSDTSNSHIDVMLYIAQSNNIAAAFDSVVVSGNSYTFTGLSGNTHYYVWARANCSDGSSREILCEFTTDVNCAPVENLRVVATDYHAFGLNWEAPNAGDPVTNYIVSYRLSGESSWISDTVSDLYYYISGLDTNHTYQYRVTTICDTLTSAITSGTVTTMGCSRMITNGGTTNSYLPTYILYDYSYTQQIYLDAEIGTGMDTITAISFYTSSTISSDDSRDIQLYLGNTDQSSFSSTGNYIPVDSLSLVYTGTFSGTGWITLNFDTFFVRTPGRNLVVAMDDNTGDWVSSISYAATSASNRSIYFYQDNTDINPASPSANSSSVVSYVNQIKLNPASCHIPTCNSPVVMIASTEGTQVNLVWNNEPGRTYTIEYLRENTTNWVVFDSTNTTGACSVTGLLSGYSYTFRVSFDCDGDLLSGTAQSRAVCAPVALPYTEDFENQSGLYSRNCWYTGSTNLGSTYPNPIVVNLEGNPNKLLLLYNGAYVILPEMDAPLNQLQIRFNFVQGGNNVRLIMGVMDDPTAPIYTIHPIDTLIRSNYDSSAYAYVVYPLNGISDTTGHLAFWDAFNDNYSFLDNIVVEYIPNCTNASDVVASNVTATSANISWTGSANAISYLVEYGSRGFTPGTGTTATSATNSIALTGLNPGSSYEAYVYAICANDTSIASQVCNFTTACAAITALPYTQNFENILGPGDNSANVVPNCWASALLPEGAGHEVPHVFYNTDLGHAPSPQYCFYFEGIGIAALPEMGVPLDSLMISFHEWNSNPSNYGLIIGAVDNTDSGFASSFQPIDTIPFVGTDNQFDVVSLLNGYTGTARHIAIASYNIAGSAYADQYLDNLVIDRIPNCIAPMRVQTAALTNVSADLAWQFSTAANYSIEYGVHGFTPGTGTTVTSTTRTVSLAGLTPYTQYDVYLTSVCSPAETSDTTFFTFTTLRGAPVTTYPYVCTFADTTEANAWEPVNGSQANKWYVGTAAHYGTVDNMGLYISNNNGVSNEYTNTSISFVYAYRTFSMNVGSYNIGFNWRANGESSWDYLRAWLAPADFEFTPGQTPDGGTSSSAYNSSNPAGWIPLDGGSKLNLESSWQTVNEDVTITTAGNYNLVFMWANDGSVGTNPPAAIDNVEVYLNTCPAPAEIFAATSGTDYIDLDWVDLGTPVSWQVEYGLSGYSRGTGTLLNVTSHPVHIGSLDTLAGYDFYVRPICAGSDTGRWSVPATINTSICDNATVATNATVCTQSTDYFPGYALYNTSYTEVIIDSADLEGLTDIIAWAFKPQNTTGGSYFGNCKVYMAHTTLSNLSSGYIADTNTFVKVFTGDLNFTTNDWQTIMLDTVFTWDGHSNIVVAVDRQFTDYISGQYFDAFTASSSKARYYYSDTDPFILGTSLNSSGTATSTVPIYHLISCGSAACRKPNIVSTTYDYESATITWSGNGTNYEVNIKETASDWPATDIPVVGNTYTFTGLMPATNYTFRVRQDCSADSLGYSEWALGNFITDSLPCLAPTNLSTTTVTNATATFDWTVRGTETAWDIHVWNTGNIDSIYTVTTRPATVGGFTAGLTYNASIRPLCGSAHNIVGDWSDTITFSTTICPTVTGLTVGNVTANGATLNWDADQMAVSWIVEYGFAGFDQGSGTIVPCTTNSFNATGLECETSYDLYVRAVCGTDWTSEHWTRVSFTTGDCSEACLAPTNVVATVDINSVTVTWIPAEGNTAFEVEYGNHGFSHGNGTVVNTNEPTTVINGLEFNTQYDLYVRALCGADNYSPWTPVTTFTTGTQGIDNAEGVACTIFPNPTSSATTISVSGVNGKVKIEVVDMNGRTVASETLECSSDCRKTMDVDHLAQGAYFVRITGENVNMVKKLIVR